ncbi:isoprenylcysteine carboxylmethyltransferase family protein [Nitratireductor rhodophyticola]|uniref:methyltransferase family protein n=1 Tax=Nitratireductor rhodophyticola TaxID=2854036 RepID=UPI00300A5BF6
MAIPVAAVLALTHSVANTDSPTHLGVEVLGWTLIGFCIVGRTWCSLYIGGRKNETLVRHGPYSVVRNPLYLFSTIGATGIGLASGSIVVGLAVGTIVAIVHNAVIRREERFLSGKLGEKYERYLAGVPRWIPKIALWRDADLVTVRPTRVAITFLDAAWFAVAIPVFEVLDRLQDVGFIPVIALLP